MNMAGIVGLQTADKETVRRMLSQITHRGDHGVKIIQQDGTTLGAVWPETQICPVPGALKKNAVWDANYPPLPDPSGVNQASEPFTLASLVKPGELFVARDALGVNPLYYSYTDSGDFCFASEVKAMLEVSQDIREFPPNTWYSSEAGFNLLVSEDNRIVKEQSLEEMVLALQMRLDQAVCKRIDRPEIGAWLSGGLDSSAIVALVRPHASVLHTFAAGMPGASDLVYAQEVADYFDTQHHEVLISMSEVLKVLPEVIYYLESFDALLVRSAVTNYLVAKKAADYVTVSFSGEGADELFAGYRHFHQLDEDVIDDETRQLTQSLHNTSLQRVDRSAAAHGLVVHVPFLDPQVVAYAQKIPASYKLKRQPRMIEKYILRKALDGILPDSVLWRKKTKVLAGNGVGGIPVRICPKKDQSVGFSYVNGLFQTGGF
jgi:asparagine synthase (glutamine-hydrolysing)